MNDLAKDVDKFEERSKDLGVQKYTAPSQDPFLATIERLASRPDIDPDKIQKFMDMNERILDRNAKQEFNAAMVRVQRSIPEVPRDKTNNGTEPPSKYSSYEMIMKHCKPVYTGEGFAISTYEGAREDEKFPPTPDGEVRIFGDVMHEGGWSKTYYVDIPLDDKGPKGTRNKTLTHAKKSSLSYGRSALMCMILNIPTGDGDDGNLAGGQQKESSDFISPDQEKKLNEAFKKTDILEGAFLKALKVETLSELPATKFDYAMKIINSRKSK